MTPTQRTLKWLRAQGYVAEVTERWNAYARVRQDLFNFIDIICIHPDRGGVLGVQTTSGANTAARITKIRGIPAARIWLQAGNEITVVGWRELVVRKLDGSKAKRKRWEPRVVAMTLADFETVEVSEIA